MITTVSDNEIAQAAEIEALRQEVTAWSITAENLEAELASKQAPYMDGFESAKQEARDAYEEIRNVCHVHERRAHKAEAERDALKADAARYRAIKSRHAYQFVMRMIGLKGYNSQKAPEQIDQFADAARAEVQSFESLSQEQKDLQMNALLKRSEIEAMKADNNE